MEPFTILTSKVAPLDAQNVDTDQIIPKQFLKRVERTGYGRFLFYDWRYLDDGRTPNPDFEMNAPQYKDARILLTKDNFGCGSSREHAPWALKDYGFRCVIAVSFADIFYNNCFNNGLLPVVLQTAEVDRLFDAARGDPEYRLTVDLANQRVVKPDGSQIDFEIGPGRKKMLLKGLDRIGLTLEHETAITEYETTHAIV